MFLCSAVNCGGKAHREADDQPLPDKRDSARGEQTGKDASNEGAGPCSTPLCGTSGDCPIEQWTSILETERYVSLQDLATEREGGYVVTGTAVGNLSTEDEDLDDQMFVGKFDAQGTAQWIRQFDNRQGTHWSSAHSVRMDQHGNVFVGGGISQETSAALSNTDLFVRKFDSTGQELWTFSVMSSGNDAARALRLDKSGNVILLGDYGVSGGTALAIKVDPEGNELWRTEINADGRLLTLELGTDGAIYWAGHGVVDPSAQVSEDGAIVAKLDPNGNELWRHSLSGLGSYASALAVDPAGNVYVASGSARRPYPEEGEESDAYLSRLDSQGNAHWSTLIADGVAHWVPSLVVDDCRVFVSGVTNWGAERPDELVDFPYHALIWAYDLSGKQLDFQIVEEFGRESFLGSNNEHSCGPVISKQSDGQLLLGACTSDGRERNYNASYVKSFSLGSD